MKYNLTSKSISYKFNNLIYDTAYNNNISFNKYRSNNFFLDISIINIKYLIRRSYYDKLVFNSAVINKNLIVKSLIK